MFERTKLRYACYRSFTNYYLIRKSMPFRDAHHSATKVSYFATKNRLEINKVPMSLQLREINEKFTDDVNGIIKGALNITRRSEVQGFPWKLQIAVKNILFCLQKLVNREISSFITAFFQTYLCRIKYKNRRLIKL